MAAQESAFAQDDLNVSGKRLTLVGILHSKEDFAKNAAEYERLIKPYSAVMLEQPLWYADFSYDQSSFGQLAAIAMKMNKKIYIADPFDARVLAADAAFGMGGLAMVVKSFMDFGKKAVYRNDFKISRKGFILRMGMLAVGLPLFLGSLPGWDLRSVVDKQTAYRYGADDIAAWGSKDWRDIWIAIGIDKVLTSVQEVQTLIAFHGIGHQQGILRYLVHPQERRREAAYLPFKKISSNLAVREWVPKKHKWELARTF